MVTTVYIMFLSCPSHVTAVLHISVYHKISQLACLP